MALDISLVFLPAWDRIKEYLTIEQCVRDGSSVDDPRIRIGFDGLPELLGREMTHVQMQCVCCLRPIFPLRRREGDSFTRLYYGCSCPVALRPACSKSRASALEYQRFKAVTVAPRPPAQLDLF